MFEPVFSGASKSSEDRLGVSIPSEEVKSGPKITDIFASDEDIAV